MIYTGNIKGDGKLELITTDGTNYNLVHYDITTLTKTTIATSVSINSTWGMLEDLNGDGYKDIGFGKRNGSNIECQFYSVSGSPTLLKKFTDTASANGHGYPSIVYADSANKKKVGCIINGWMDNTYNPRGFSIFDYSSGSRDWFYNTGGYADTLIVTSNYIIPGFIFGPNNGIINDSNTNGDRNLDLFGYSFIFDYLGNRITRVPHPLEGLSMRHWARYYGTSSYTTYKTIIDACYVTPGFIELPIYECFDRSLNFASGGGMYHSYLLTKNGFKFYSIRNRGTFYYTGDSKIYQIDIDTLIKKTFSGAPNVSIIPSLFDLDNDGFEEILFSYISDDKTSIPLYPQVILDNCLNILSKSPQKGAILFTGDILGLGKPQIFIAEGNKLAAYQIDKTSSYAIDSNGCSANIDNTNMYSWTKLWEASITDTLNGVNSPIYEAIPSDLDNDMVNEIIIRTANKITILRANPSLP